MEFFLLMLMETNNKWKTLGKNMICNFFEFLMPVYQESSFIETCWL